MIHHLSSLGPQLHLTRGRREFETNQSNNLHRGLLQEFYLFFFFSRCERSEKERNASSFMPVIDMSQRGGKTPKQRITAKISPGLTILRNCNKSRSESELGSLVLCRSGSLAVSSKRDKGAGTAR